MVTRARRLPKQGFSLIETLVVVAVLGVVSAIALPPMLPQVHRAQISGEAEAVAGFISRARVEALVRKRCVRVVITRAANPVELTAQVLNTFDCDHEPHTAARIDPALPRRSRPRTPASPRSCATGPRAGCGPRTTSSRTTTASCASRMPAWCRARTR